MGFAPLRGTCAARRKFRRNRRGGKQNKPEKATSTGRGRWSCGGLRRVALEVTAVFCGHGRCFFLEVFLGFPIWRLKRHNLQFAGRSLLWFIAAPDTKNRRLNGFFLWGKLRISLRLIDSSRIQSGASLPREVHPGSEMASQNDPNHQATYPLTPAGEPGTAGQRRVLSCG